MIIEKPLLSVLKNFSSINNSLWVDREKPTIRTMSPQRTIVAQYGPVSVPVSFGIFDLSQFLSVLSLTQDPQVDFKEKYLEVTGKNGARIKYWYAANELIPKVPDKDLTIQDPVFQFDLSSEEVKEVTSFASALQLPTLAVTSHGGDVVLRVTDSTKELSSNEYRRLIGHSEKEFDVPIRVENLKMMALKYRVSLGNGICQFDSVDTGLKYWLATEAK